MDKYSEFVNSTELKDIFIVKLMVDNRIRYKDELPSLKLEFSYSYSIDEENGFEITQTLQLIGRLKRKIAFKVLITQQLDYHVDDAELLNSEHVETYAKSSAILHGWPYLRETVSTLFAKMGYPPLFLPLLKIPSEEE